MSREDFWSRRKARVEAERAAEQERAAAIAAAREDAALAAEQEEKTDEEILAELNLPLPEEIRPGQDVTAFMSKAVPQRLRQRALRQLWRVNPALANLDNLLEYGEDYTDAATVVENLQTAYQVGKGMLRHVEKMAAEAEAEAAARERLAAGEDGDGALDTAAQDTAEDEGTPPAVMGHNSAGEEIALEEPQSREPHEDDAENTAQVETPPAARAALSAQDDDAEPPRAPRRRMRFAHAQE
ncbi:DUF3306 domain-containing protein [Profundibacterium mesophilum]|uniref:DUF3306 domain-containing protein n=1 Tax=Profundibacterium mesophilum KAUST100406-0324 TaxID=1037889 RepID=A0A921TCC9_9RHOB|nr:DUF3306 domain-containing protein [Profundibacterium mesophilum]KAF0676950.1 hypothetical protein PMES_00747 [Profundibacterium mesophilum KAUST100406-0324]